ncbi:homeobox protein Hox-D3-like [Physella acuta]|uniref:homeobox protein Hox-D3-like n=1 Tax=Physella acuta TaxID=109671 RepID=UPI0027DC95C1|nr:homeobox protein Hox-D3-like [Physella acuta]
MQSKPTADPTPSHNDDDSDINIDDVTDDESCDVDDRLSPSSRDSNSKSEDEDGGDARACHKDLKAGFKQDDCLQAATLQNSPLKTDIPEDDVTTCHGREDRLVDYPRTVPDYRHFEAQLREERLRHSTFMGQGHWTELLNQHRPLHPPPFVVPGLAAPVSQRHVVSVGGHHHDLGQRCTSPDVAHPHDSFTGRGGHGGQETVDNSRRDAGLEHLHSQGSLQISSPPGLGVGTHISAFSKTNGRNSPRSPAYQDRSFSHAGVYPPLRESSPPSPSHAHHHAGVYPPVRERSPPSPSHAHQHTGVYPPVRERSSPSPSHVHHHAGVYPPVRERSPPSPSHAHHHASQPWEHRPHKKLRTIEETVTSKQDPSDMYRRDVTGTADEIRDMTSPGPASSPGSQFNYLRDSPTDNQSRRYRTAFTKDQITKLEQEFSKENYISRPKRCELAASMNLPESTIKVWFQNRRMKDKRQRLSLTWPYGIAPDHHLYAYLAAAASASFPHGPPGSSQLPSQPASLLSLLYPRGAPYVSPAYQMPPIFPFTPGDAPGASSFLKSHIPEHELAFHPEKRASFDDVMFRKPLPRIPVNPSGGTPPFPFMLPMFPFGID